MHVDMCSGMCMLSIHVYLDPQHTPCADSSSLVMMQLSSSSHPVLMADLFLCRWASSGLRQSPSLVCAMMRLSSGQSLLCSRCWPLLLEMCCPETGGCGQQAFCVRCDGQCLRCPCWPMFPALCGPETGGCSQQEFCVRCDGWYPK